MSGKLDQIPVSREKPLLCLEVNPPRGVDFEPIFKRLEGRIDGVDFFNVTDSALAKMKVAPLPFASILKQRFGVEPLVNVACRDRNLIGLQADLLAGWATGIRSVVALTGDAVTTGDSPDRKGVFEVNSIGLLEAIATLNSGRDLAGNELKGSPEFFPGVVVNPNARSPGAEIRRLQRKKEAGARFALSQPVFDRQVSVEFFKAAKGVGLPLFVGLLPFKTVRAAEAVSKIPGMRLSDELKSRISGASPETDISFHSLELCIELARANREFVRGFHVVTGANAALALELAAALTKEIRG